MSPVIHCYLKKSWAISHWCKKPELIWLLSVISCHHSLKSIRLNDCIKWFIDIVVSLGSIQQSIVICQDMWMTAAILICLLLCVCLFLWPMVNIIALLPPTLSSHRSEVNALPILLSKYLIVSYQESMSFLKMFMVRMGLCTFSTLHISSDQLLPNIGWALANSMHILFPWTLPKNASSENQLHYITLPSSSISQP